MSAADPFASYRALLREGVKQALVEQKGSHAALLHAQLAEGDPPREGPAPLLCLLTADALGARPENALPAATALLLLTEMGRVFRDIAADGAGLAKPWGMPRALNAGDGLFALAQDALLAADAGLSADRRLRALDLLDAAARALGGELEAAAEGAAAPPGSSLLAAALALGGLAAGAGADIVEQLGAYGASLAAGAPDDVLLGGLAPDARRRLAEATAQLATETRP